MIKSIFNFILISFMISVSFFEAMKFHAFFIIKFFYILFKCKLEWCVAPAINGNTIRIFVESADESSFTFYVEKTGIISDVKDEIDIREDVPIDEQYLYYNNQLLDDDRTIISYGIKDGDTLILQIIAYEKDPTLLSNVLMK